MAQGELRPEEQRAADVVVRLLQGRRFVLRDVPGTDGMYDFDIVDGEGTVVASVEVTTIADEPHRRTWNEKTLDRHRRGAPMRNGWSVSFWKMETVRLDEVMAKVHDQLLVLEAQGRDQLDIDEDDADPVRSALTALGVLGVDVVDGLPAGHVVLCSIDADTQSWTALEDAIEVCAAKKAKQLARADPDVQRILFAWIDPSRGDLTSQLDRWDGPVFGMPARTLDLPDVIDTVIVGKRTEDGNRFYRWPGFSPFNTSISQASTNDTA